MKRQNGNQVNARHARMILLSRGGMSNRHLAERVDCTPQWVRKILHRFNEGALPAIEWYSYYCGRSGPIKFLSDVVEQIAEVALAPPRTLIGMNQWSLSKLREYLIEQKIVGSISVSWLREVLRRCGVRLRRTKTWKDSTDPLFWPRYRAIRRLYRKPPSDGRVLCMDEFGPLNLQPRHGTHWGGPGKRIERLRATYSRKGGVRHMFAVYDLKTDRLYGRFASKKNWGTFLDFLRWVRRRYPSKKTLYVIVDQAGYHRKAEVRAWAARHRIRFFFTPTNASWLNRIECHLTALRKFALDNSDFRAHTDQQKAIERYLEWRNRKRNISLQAWKTYKRHGNIRKVAA
jgi:transposase